VLAQPSHEIHHIGVAPHPARKPDEVAERCFRARLLRCTADPAVHAIGVRPVRFYRNQAEPVISDERLRELSADTVELVCSVRGFADEHEPCIADGLEKRRHRPCRGIELNRVGADEFSEGACHYRFLAMASLSCSRFRTSASVVCEKSTYH
jgi:hypothetical protein